ncbi:MAG: ABC transporter transmembrane domain-containing protein, partial [bacterium]|nr:ABC transporter transmembrane domain-containing protein [bacterium]
MKTVTKQTYTLFWNHAKRQWWLGVFVLLGLTIGVATEVIAPLYYKRIFDVLAAPAGMDAKSQVAELIRLLLSIVGLYMVGWLGWRFSMFSNNRFVPTLATQVAETCFEYLHKHSYGFFTNRFVGAIVRKVTRLVDACEGLTERIFWDLFPLALRTVLIVGIIFYYSAVIGSVLLGWAILYLVINYYFALYKLRYDAERAAVDSETTAQLADTITNNTNIKAFTSLKDELRWFRELLDRQRRLRVFTWDLESYMFALQDVLMVAVEFAV